jgi:hypothetical protein
MCHSRRPFPHRVVVHSLNPTDARADARLGAAQQLVPIPLPILRRLGGSNEALLKPANRKKLVEILTFHVVPGRLTAADVQRAPVADTVQGTSLLFGKTDKGVAVDGATILTADIIATNGVIHVVDRVLLPKDIVETAARAGQFNTLLAAVKAAGLAGALKKHPSLETLVLSADCAFVRVNVRKYVVVDRFQHVVEFSPDGGPGVQR